MRWVTMRLMSTGAEAEIPERAVDGHRALGWLPLDEIPADDQADTAGDTAGTGTNAEQAAEPADITTEKTTARRRSSAGTTAQEG